jgi:hypothetical protein
VTDVIFQLCKKISGKIVGMAGIAQIEGGIRGKYMAPPPPTPDKELLWHMSKTMAAIFHQATR